MNNKFNLTREQNVFVAKRNIVDYIWKSANLEGIGVTYPETQAIYDGGIVNGLTVDNIIAICNLKNAWQFILENKDINYNFNVLCHIHKLVADRLVLEQDLGKIRTTPVPIESQIIEELNSLLNQEDKSKLFANRIMIDNGCGIISIAQEYQPTFYEKLIKYYETNDMNDLKKWIYDHCIDGINL